MTKTVWETYVENTKNAKPRPLLVKAVELAKEKNEALDLGSGALNDVRYLVEIGFKHITAVDAEPVAKDIISNFPPETVDYIISTFENFDFKESHYDLINAQFALPFNPPATFNEVWDKITSSLKSGGVITGQFFGIRDEWNVEGKKMNFHTIEETKEYLSSLELVQFREDEADRETAAGNMKHWHVFHFISIKK